MRLDEVNKALHTKSPREIIEWGMNQGKSTILSTSFGPYSAPIIQAVTDVQPNIKVVWVDTGYNTPNTYRYAHEMIGRFELNLHTYSPSQSKGYRDIALGIPMVDDPSHKQFTEEVKLEPFSRAMNEHKPQVWFTNLRKGQTAFRDSIGIVSTTTEGVIKVSPFYHWSDAELDNYMQEFDLPNEKKYFDPTKQLKNRECGLHTRL